MTAVEIGIQSIVITEKTIHNTAIVYFITYSMCFLKEFSVYLLPIIISYAGMLHLLVFLYVSF